MNIEPNPTVATSARTRRTVLRKPMLAVPVLIAVLAGSAVGVNATDDTDPDDTELDGLVTEEVEPGVERIISDGAGHDLDERHPTYRYDMDDVAVTPDGAVLLWSRLPRDRPRCPPWGCGRRSACAPVDTRGAWDVRAARRSTASLCRKRRALACYCVDTPEGVETTYLAGTLINEVVVAPDGTIWAVGDYDGEGGGLYRITHERLTTN